MTETKNGETFPGDLEEGLLHLFEHGEGERPRAGGKVEFVPRERGGSDVRAQGGHRQNQNRGPGPINK